ncbi:hypothetical protein BO78DRAFT_432001 [Aspergillus sclerotiicarbonarius CBS 121057]|uniref:non-specific serine/threonine protein kinase n=1 Tax=Aspergillus sclerotiicarbonarius (strain CBS 121057 / IBT 28362) TaxID=1448318 RepID=A0A319E0Y2_ASPSB|nr:hypothetical protein BO78DRAFT_432001 [Aspergillus sclerotiicarbonarius CBS 121057]
MSDINHQTYPTRLSQLHRISHQHDLKIHTITPIAYQALGPCPYNNFIYKIELSEPPNLSFFFSSSSSSSSSGYASIPGTKSNEYISPPPEGETVFVIRMSNPLAMGINSLSDRVENEIVAMYLARRGLDSVNPGLGDLIPRVYAFCSKPQDDDDDGGRQGDLPWTMMEYKPGVELNEVYDDLSAEVKEDVLGQVADVVAGVQRPVSGGSIGGLYGGLGLGKDVDGDGGIIGTEMTTTSGGPWKSYEMFLQARLRHELGDAEKSPVIDGWKGNGVRERLEGLIERVGRTLSSLMKSGVEERRVLVHGDLTMNNILISPTTHKLTALLDFDFACIAHPAHEYLVSLQDLGGNVMGPYGEDPTQGKLSQALLSGDFSEDVPDTLWWTGKTLDEMLKRRGVKRPCEMMPGMEVLRQWRALEQLLCPFHLTAPFIVQRMTEEQRAGARKGAEEELVAQMEVLDKWEG